MREYLHKYQKIIVLLPFKNWSLALVAINLLMILAVTLLQGSLPPVVPLFYGNPYGLEQLAARGSLVLPSAAAFIICLLCIFISLALEDDFLKKVLFGAMVATTLLAVVTTVKIIFLVGVI